MVLASSQALWYLTRATGLVSLVLLTLSVVLGITEALRWAHPRWPRLITAGLHKNVSLLVTVFLAVHIVTAVADTFAPIRWLNVVVPFTSAYRPVWVGLGAVAVDLLIALIVTSLLRRRIGYRAWRAVHWAAYACWPVALLHGLGTGSDTRMGWALALQTASLVLVIAAVEWRLASGWSADVHRRVLAAVGSGVVVAGIVGFALVGPLRTGWARRAGTPTALLASSTGAAAVASAPSGLTVPFTSYLQGSVTQVPSAGGDTTVTIAATLRGNVAGALRLVLQGQPVTGGGVRMLSSSATLGTVDRPTEYQGQIVSLAGTQVVATLADAGGHRIELTLDLQIDDGSGSLTGTAAATLLSTGGDHG